MALMAQEEESAPRPAALRAPVAQSGRSLGPRALRTRERILQATAALLDERSVLDLPVVDIARRAGTSPATFYHYFRDVEAAALTLAEHASAEMPDVSSWIRASFRGSEGLARARATVDAFLDHWDRHHAILMLRNMAADRGDARFQQVRQDHIGPVLAALASEVERGQADGRISRELHPLAAAAALASFLERLSAHHRDLRGLGLTRDDVRETCARMLIQTLEGQFPA